MLDQPGAA